MTTTNEPTAKEIDLTTLLKWSEPKLTATANGDRYLCKAEPTEEFWKLWASQKAELRAAGISCGEWPKGSRKWQVCWWKPLTQADVKQRTETMEASRATDAEIAIPGPDGYSYLGYQKAGVSFMMRRFGSGQEQGVLLGDEMGLGKTIQAIGLMNFDAKIQRVLIICPATLKFNWLKELRRWLVRDMSIEVADSKCFPSADVVIINFDILHKFEKSLSNFWDLIVIDEAHYLVNRKARRTKCVFGYKPSKKEIQKRAQADGTDETVAAAKLLIPALNARRKLAMTGTPMVNRAADLFPIINWLDPQKWNNGFKFLIRYCGGKQTGFGWDFTGATNTEELNRELRSGLMLRRLKKDVLKDLPSKLRKVVELPNDAESQAYVDEENEEYEQRSEKLERLAVAVELAKAGDDREAFKAAVLALNENVKAVFTEMARVRHMTALAKLPQVIAKLKELEEEDPDHKIVIFAHHRDVIAALKAEWPNASVVIGGMESEDKMKQVERFQNDPTVTKFLGGLRAASEGITLTASSHVIFVEEDWTPGKMSQAEDRCHRIGQHDNVLVEHWVLAKSLDVRIAQATVDKQEVMDKILDEIQKSEAGEAAVIPTKFTLITGTTKSAPDKETATFNAIAEAAKSITPEQIAAVHMALRMLAGMDTDRAREVNGIGFNKLDVVIGHSLAERDRLTPKQAVLGRKIACKYVKQIGQDLVDRMKGTK